MCACDVIVKLEQQEIFSSLDKAALRENAQTLMAFFIYIPHHSRLSSLARFVRSVQTDWLAGHLQSSLLF